MYKGFASDSGCVCVCVSHPDPTLKVTDPSYLLNGDVGDYHNDVDGDDNCEEDDAPVASSAGGVRSVPEGESARAAPTEARGSAGSLILLRFIFFP